MLINIGYIGEIMLKYLLKNRERKTHNRFLVALEFLRCKKIAGLFKKKKNIVSIGYDTKNRHI